MTQKKEKAIIAVVDYGFAQVNGLMLDGVYGIAVPQVCEFYQITKNQGSRYIKAILGKDFSFDFLKWKSELNSKAVNVLLLNDFALLSYELGKRGNSLADDFNKAAIIETHERRFDRAFGNKRSEDEYNARLKARMEGKEVRWELTDSIKAYILRHNITGDKAKFMYKNTTDRLYKHLTGQTAQALREWIGIPKSKTPRDYCSDRDLMHIKEIENATQRYIDFKDYHPYEAIDVVIESLLLKNIGITPKDKL